MFFNLFAKSTVEYIGLKSERSNKISKMETPLSSASLGTPTCGGQECWCWAHAALLSWLNLLHSVFYVLLSVWFSAGFGITQKLHLSQTTFGFCLEVLLLLVMGLPSFSLTSGISGLNFETFGSMFTVDRKMYWGKKIDSKPFYPHKKC